MHIDKYQGAGNDFLIMEGEDPGTATDAFAQRICDRHFGIGADGLVRVGRDGGADLRMVIRNADGSRADMCGNALRCVARRHYDRHPQAAPSLVVATDQGPLSVQNTEDGLRTALGIPRLLREEIPMTGPPGRVVKETLSAAGGHWEITALFLGNPHCVVFFEEIDALDLPRVGLAIERHPVFPRRANVEFVQIVDRRTVRQRTWERGCGETLACGTGAGAVAVAGRLTGYLEVPLRVQLRGGSLVVDWEKEGDPVFATGPAEHVFTAEWPSA